MAGLLNSNSSSALQQWHRLFEARGLGQSKYASGHLQQMLRLGLPGRKHENWKYTGLDGLLNHAFILPAPADVSASQCRDLALTLDAVRLVFVDGVFNPLLSDDLPDSGYHIKVDNQRETLPSAVQPEVFLHLTESLSVSVTHIVVAANTRPARPLVLMHISSGDDPEGSLNTVHYRHHLELQSGASATVIEHFVSLDSGAHFTGGRLTMQVGANARLEHYKLAFENSASYHFAHNDIRAEQDAVVHSSSFLLGAGLLRHHTSTELNGENITLRLNSLALPVANEVCDTRTWLAHNRGYCNSRQLHKTIVRDKGRAVFNGLINVAPHAIKTDGQMTNNNLLIGRLAEVDTKPQLEIYADDVKCSHGATIGRLDDEQLFYLRSRGISEDSARQVILHAFAAELSEAISDPDLKRQVLDRITVRFGGGNYDTVS
ncbi:Fe-S cluster assembly protein SufD [Shimwellia pseudoproteus]|uniref:Fe-S cluster assembly protein SufD n=1 Tax=Shimwellia pseudoproteus TaxID=570012 RepID=UPI0018EA8507|nr:Fe-S cluster assembly protein SufD [Shimwellia pseudoproteus]MBJ3813643.1 Fe-S cluster assembly protein SufD [Shimwellia pseudoproteus]